MVITDYNGNVIEFTGTRQEALDAGHNVDCISCRQCRSCSDCSYCSYCSRCSRCSYCSNCSRCPNQPHANLITDIWVICIRTNNTIEIGCQDHPTQHWLDFDDETIKLMHNNALVWWRKWKPVIISILEQCKEPENVTTE